MPYPFHYGTDGNWAFAFSVLHVPHFLQPKLEKGIWGLFSTTGDSHNLNEETFKCFTDSNTKNYINIFSFELKMDSLKFLIAFIIQFALIFL